MYERVMPPYEMTIGQNILSLNCAGKLERYGSLRSCFRMISSTPQIPHTLLGGPWFHSWLPPNPHPTRILMVIGVPVNHGQDCKAPLCP